MSVWTPNSKVQTPSALPSRPIDTLPTQPSLFFANLHPVLLLSGLLLSFKSLVNDPVNTLLGLAPTVAILQGAYCVLCLPSTGQTSTTTAKAGAKKKASKQGQDVWSKIVPATLSLLLTLFLTSPALYIALILFGAPLTTHIPQTLLLSLHLALLTTPQLFYTHGLDKEVWFKIVSLQIPVDEVMGLSLGACVGAWVGAVPIPLDWDREWQKWPVTVVAGLYVGAVLGKVVGGWMFRGGRIKIS